MVPLKLKLLLTLLMLSFFQNPGKAQISSQVERDLEKILHTATLEQARSFLNSQRSLSDTNESQKTYLILLGTYIDKASGDYEKAYQITDSLLNTGSFEKDPEYLAQAMFLKGYYAGLLDRDATAIQYYLKVDSLASEHQGISLPRARALNYMGELLLGVQYISYMTHLSKPSEWFERAAKEAEKAGDSVIWYRAAANVAFARSVPHKPGVKEIPEVFYKALSFYKRQFYPDHISRMYRLMTQLGFYNGDTEQAIKLSSDFLEYAKKKGDPELLFDANVISASILNLAGYPALGLDKVLTAHVIKDSFGLNINPEDKYRFLTQLADLNKKNSRFQEALLAKEKLFKLQDSIKNISVFEQIKEIETRYQTEKKEQEIALLKAEKEVGIYQRFVLLGIAVLAGLGGVFFFILWRNRQQTTQKLKELDRAKSRFFANISHEFRTPLTLITAPLEQYLERPSASPEEVKDFSMMRTNANRILQLVDQLMDLSRLESGHFKLQVREENPGIMVKGIAESFTYLATKKNIDFHIQVPDTGFHWLDRDVWEKILANLLSNAFKFTPKEGKVSLEMRIHSNYCILSCSNSLERKPTHNPSSLFDRFYSEDTSRGSGVGLALVRELVLLSKGTVGAIYLNENTLCFRVQLPVGRNSFTSEELGADDTNPISQFSEALPSEVIDLKANNLISEEQEEVVKPPKQKNGRKLLLLIEDQEDLRHYICSLFSREFEVIEAVDGQEGMDIAIERIPDIVISDVMMPEMSGFELCNRLKSDTKTSHIPVVLLTAKADEEAQYDGLQTGADDYIAKPFNARILVQKIKNILTNRDRLRTSLQPDRVLIPGEIKMSSLDEDFMEKIRLTFANHISNPSFSSEEFSMEMGMSRMQLHRKLKALTGFSSSELIRSHRLTLAADLLRKSNRQVAEIGYAVGFSDASYFSKCFREVYHCTPTEFSERAKIGETQNK